MTGVPPSFLGLDHVKVMLVSVWSEQVGVPVDPGGSENYKKYYKVEQQKKRHVCVLPIPLILLKSFHIFSNK